MLDLVLHGVDLRGKGTIWIAKDGGSHDVTRHATGPAKVCLLCDVDVWYILINELARFGAYLILAKEWEMKNDFKWFGIGSEHYQVSETSVEGFSGLVCAFLQLYHLTKLAHVINSIIRNYHEKLRTCFAWTDWLSSSTISLLSLLSALGQARDFSTVCSTIVNFLL